MRAVQHVLVTQELLEQLEPGDGPIETRYRVVDDGDLMLLDGSGDRSVPLWFRDPVAGAPAPAAETDNLQLCAWPTDPAADRVLTAFRRDADGWSELTSSVRPRNPDVFDRVRGVFESDRLRDACVLVLGVGSGGSFIVRELVRAGVGHFVLIDYDRLDQANVCRHELGLADMGRLKVNAMRDYIHDRNPAAKVSGHAFQLAGAELTRFLDICAETKPDLIVCGTDNRESRLLVNRIALLLGIVALYGGVRRRAYAGQVLRVIPGVTPCYQCFIAGVPEIATDVEISTETEALRFAYTDRVVVPEPGLSTDIAPVALFMAKLALIELTLDHENSIFKSLRTDLVAPWFFWLNRREEGTQFESWPPIAARSDGPGVMRWMGQYLERDVECVACGDLADDVGDNPAALIGDG